MEPVPPIFVLAHGLQRHRPWESGGALAVYRSNDDLAMHLESWVPETDGVRAWDATGHLLTLDVTDARVTAEATPADDSPGLQGAIRADLAFYGAAAPEETPLEALVAQIAPDYEISIGPGAVSNRIRGRSRRRWIRRRSKT